MPGEIFKHNIQQTFSFGKYIYPIVAVIIFLLTFLTEWYLLLARVLLIVTVLMVLNRLGKAIILRELIALHTIFVCVFMPTLGYTIFSKENALAKLWVRYMPVPEAEYFSYALPATAIFVAALCWPLNSPKTADHGQAIQALVDKAKQRLQFIPKVGFYLMGMGVLTFFISPYMPNVLQFVFTLMFWASFAGVLYIYYTRELKHKPLILSAFIMFLFFDALRSGMFTILVYMGITMFSFFFLGRKTALWKKVAIFFIGIVVIFMIQSVKVGFRKATWFQGYEGNKGVLFVDLLVQRLNSSESLLDEKSIFHLYFRTNQGFNVALVMYRFPRLKSHDNGVNLFRSFASAFVPRFLWPDKPEAGGKFNMLYYTGMNISGWSTNIGPLGEAYGSFGRSGGIIFMFALGIFIRWAYSRIIVIANKMPLVLFWIPVLFYQITYSAETDTLSIFNSLFKSAFFVFLIYKLFPVLFGVVKQQVKRVRRNIHSEGVTTIHKPL